jgi:hypothetical protein
MPEEITDDPVVADVRNFYKVELWTGDDFIERLLFAGTSLDGRALSLPIPPGTAGCPLGFPGRLLCLLLRMGGLGVIHRRLCNHASSHCDDDGQRQRTESDNGEDAGHSAYPHRVVRLSITARLESQL